MATREIVALNEDVPQLQVPGATDTYLLARDMDAGGNDITNVGELTAETVNGEIIASKLTTLYDSDQTKPVIILAFGDSNMAGIGGSEIGLQSPNTDVWFYASDGIGTPYQDPATDLAWRNVDPTAAVVTDIDFGGTPPYWGLLRNNNGSTAFAIGNRVQKRIKRDVYVISLFKGGSTLAFWQPGGGAGKEGMTALNSYLDAAIAAVPNTPGYISIVVMSCGVNDANTTVNPATFVANFKAMYAEMVTQTWIKEYETQWFQLDYSEFVDDGNGKPWMGMQYLDNSTNDYVRVISSQGLPLDVDDVHFQPFALNYFGIVAADAALANVSTSTLIRPDSYVERLTPSIVGPMDANNNTITDIAYLDIAYTANSVTLGAGVAVPSFIAVTDNHTWNTNPGGPTFAGTAMPGVVSFAGTHTIATNTNAFGMGSLFSATGTVTNAAACTAFTTFYALINTTKFLASGANLTQATISSFVDGPTIQADSGRTYTVTTLAHYEAVLNLGGGGGGTTTVTNRTGFVCNSNALGSGGVLTREAAFSCAALIGTNSTNFLGGTTTIPTGKFNMYQADALVNRWNGGHRLAYRAIAATGTTALTVADHIIEATATTSTQTFTLPAVSGNAGLHIIIKKTGTVNLTIDGSGAETIDGAANVPLNTQYHCWEGVCNGTQWLTIRTGAV
jgi:hypothetical protein